MSDPAPDWHPFERAFHGFAAHVLGLEGAAAELESSRGTFFPERDPRERPGEDRERALAERRHLEWFLFERPCAALGGDIPVQAVAESFADGAPAEEAGYVDAFVHSFSGMFHVSAVDPGNGLWIDDLTGRGSYPVTEPGAATGIEIGDV